MPRPSFRDKNHPGYAAASDPVRLTTMPEELYTIEKLGAGVIRIQSKLPTAPGPARLTGMFLL